MKNFVIGVMWLFVAGFIAAGSFMLKNDVIDLENQVDEANRQISHDKKAIHVLKAEWSHLNDPVRIRKLSSQYLHMRPMKADQFITFQDIQFKGRKVMVKSALKPAKDSGGKDSLKVRKSAKNSITNNLPEKEKGLTR